MTPPLNPKDTSFRLAFYVWNNRKKQLVRVVTVRPPAAPSPGGAFTSPVTLPIADHWAPGAYNLVIEATPPDRRHALGSIELR